MSCDVKMVSLVITILTSTYYVIYTFGVFMIRIHINFLAQLLSTFSLVLLKASCSSCSGPFRFDWDRDAQAWIYRRTKVKLLTLLESEMEQLCGEPISLS